MPDLTSGAVRDEARVAGERRDWTEFGSRQPSARKYARLIRKRQRWTDRRNTVAAGVCAMQAAEAGAWLHVECALKFGPGLIAEDIPEQLPAVFRDLGL